MPEEVLAAVRDLASGDVIRQDAALQLLAERNDLWTLSIAEFLRDSPASRAHATRVLADCRDAVLPAFIREVQRGALRARTHAARGLPGSDADAGIDWGTRFGPSSQDYDWLRMAAQSHDVEERALAACWLPLLPWEGVEYCLPAMVRLLRDPYEPVRMLAQSSLGPAAGVFLRSRAANDVRERDFTPLGTDEISTLCAWLSGKDPALLWAAARIVWIRRGADASLVDCVTEQLARIAADPAERPWARSEWLTAALEGEVNLSAHARERLEYCLMRVGDEERGYVDLVELCVAKLGLDGVLAVLPEGGVTAVLARASAAAAGDPSVIADEELRGLLRSRAKDVLQLGVRAAVAGQGRGSDFARDLAAWHPTEIREDRVLPPGHSGSALDRCPAPLAVAWGCAVMDVQHPEMIHLLSMALRANGVREEARRYLQDLSDRSRGGIDLDVSLVPLLWWQPESPLLAAAANLLSQSAGHGFGIPEAAVAAFERADPWTGSRVSLVRLFRRRLGSAADEWRRVMSGARITDPLLLYQIYRTL